MTFESVLVAATVAFLAVTLGLIVAIIVAGRRTRPTKL